MNATTSSVTIRECTRPTELFRHYDGQSEAQTAYIALDLESGAMWASYNAIIGSGTPEEVYHGRERWYGIPALTAASANRVMTALKPLAERIIADSDIEWNGHNMVGVLGKDAQAAEDEIEDLLGGGDDRESRLFDAEADVVQEWDIDGAVNGDEASEYDITADTTDERLDEIAAEITEALAACGTSGVAVVHGLDEYLQGLRDDLQAEAGQMSDAEFRTLRQSLGLTGDWLADHLGVAPRTVRHWEQGKYKVPYGVAKTLRGLEEETAALVKRTVEELLADYATGPTPELTVYRTDEDYLATNPDPARTASWHRAFAARVAQQAPVTITY